MRLRVNWKPALPRTPFGRMAFPGSEGTGGLELFGAVGDPENVIEFLWMPRVRVIGAFVFVLDVGAGGLHCRPLFSRCVGGAAVDGTTGRLRMGGVGESEWKSKRNSYSGKEEQAKNFLTHLVLQTGSVTSLIEARGLHPNLCIISDWTPKRRQSARARSNALIPP